MHLPGRDLSASSHEFSSYSMSGTQHLFPAACPLAGLLSFCILTSCVAVRGRIGKPRAVWLLCEVFLPMFVGQIYLCPFLP